MFAATLFSGCSQASGQTQSSQGQTSTPTATQSGTQSGTQTGSLSGTLHIFHAGSLTVPIGQVDTAFNKLYPDVQVLTESAGSATTIRKVTDLGKEPGIIASADYSLIPKMMYSKYANYDIVFATNQMCIVYTDKSKYASEINSNNWYQILQKPGVKFGHSDPNQDPCGYRSLMVWQLAEKYYKDPGLFNSLNSSSDIVIRPKEVDLNALIQSGDLDYAFEYTSIAAQQGFKYVQLPPQINLSDASQSSYYSQAQVVIAGSQPGTTQTMTGAPIVYGVTIPTNTTERKLAIAWLQVLLGQTGQKIMTENGQPPVVPATIDNMDNVPQKLQPFLKPRS